MPYRSKPLTIKNAHWFRSRRYNMLRALSVLVLLLLPSVANAEKTKIVIDGYRSGELAFGDVFARVPAEEKEQINHLIDLLASVEANPSAQNFVVVVIIGHSDRQDNVQLFPTAEA